MFHCAGVRGVSPTPAPLPSYVHAADQSALDSGPPARSADDFKGLDLDDLALVSAPVPVRECAGCGGSRGWALEPCGGVAVEAPAASGRSVSARDVWIVGGIHLRSTHLRVSSPNGSHPGCR